MSGSGGDSDLPEKALTDSWHSTAEGRSRGCMLNIERLKVGALLQLYPVAKVNSYFLVTKVNRKSIRGDFLYYHYDKDGYYPSNEINVFWRHALIPTDARRIA